MEVITKSENTLNLKKIIISECIFKRSEDTLENLKLHLRTKCIKNFPVGEMNPDEHKITLEVSLKDDAEKFKLIVKCVACFTTTQEDDALMIEKNVVALIFPYVRSYISSITSQPGMSPIVLPIINVVDMYKNN